MAGNSFGGSSFGLQYRGTSAAQPPSWNFRNRNPTRFDINHSLGDFWMNTNVDDDDFKGVWVLVSLYGDTGSKGAVAEWKRFDIGDIETLTGDTGGSILPDANFNINTLSGIANLTIDGDPVTNTLTWNSSGGGALLETLTGDIGGPVSPDANGNINTVSGSPNLTITGNPGTNTLTYTLGSIGTLETITPDTGDVVAPDGAGNINFDANTNSGETIVFDGDAATFTVSLKVSDANNNIALGVNAGSSLTGTALSNTLIGSNVATGLTTGDRNIMIGNGVGTNITTEDGCILIGDTLVDGVVGQSGLVHVGILGGGLGTYLTNFGGTKLGNEVGNFTNTGTANHGLGDSIFQSLTTGFDNVALGGRCLQDTTTGLYNTVGGNSTLNYLTTGIGNTAFGFQVGFHWATPGAGLITGMRNCLFGFRTGENFTGSESDNIYIANFGVTGESNVTRIGKGTGTGTFEQNKCFISGIRGITTNANDAIAVLVDSNNQLGTVSSSIRYKENVKPIERSILDFEPVQFNYKTDKSKSVAYGFIAEDVEKIAPELVVYDKESGQPETLKYHQMYGLLLNEIQRLHKRIEVLEGK